MKKYENFYTIIPSKDDLDEIDDYLEIYSADSIEVYGKIVVQFFNEEEVAKFWSDGVARLSEIGYSSDHKRLQFLTFAKDSTRFEKFCELVEKYECDVYQLVFPYNHFIPDEERRKRIALRNFDYYDQP
jgi:hypothetical protein